MLIRNRIIYLSILFMSFVFVYFYGGRVPYTIFYFVIFMPIVSILYTVLVFFRFKYSQDVDNKFVVKGDKVKFLFKIMNEDFFIYPYINVTFCGADTIFSRQFQTKNFSLLPLDGKTFSFELECKYRGTYEIGIRSIDIEDFFGLISLAFKTLENKLINVNPRIIRLDRMRLRTNYLSETYPIFNGRDEDMTTISDIRDYHYGDTLKKIHWKLTSKMNRILVKNFQSTSETNAIIVLDLQQGKFSVEYNTILEDKLIEAAVSVVHYCLTNWIPIRLVYFTDTINCIDARNVLDFQVLYNIIAKLKFTQTMGIKDIIDVYLRDNINTTNLVLMTSNVDYDLYDLIHRTRFSGYDVSLVYVAPDNLTGVCDSDTDTIFSFLPEIDVDYYKINIDDDIKLVLES